MFSKANDPAKKPKKKQGETSWRTQPKGAANFFWIAGISLFLFASCSKPGPRLNETEISQRDQTALSNYLQKLSVLNQEQANDAKDIDLSDDQRGSNLNTRVSNVQTLALATMNAFIRKDKISDLTQSDGWIQIRLVKIFEGKYQGDYFLSVNATRHGINDWYGSASYLQKRKGSYIQTGECSSSNFIVINNGTLEDGKLVHGASLFRPSGVGSGVGLIWDGKKLYFGPPPDPNRHPLISVSKNGITNLNVFGTTVPIYKHRPLGSGVWANFNGEHRIKIGNKKFYMTNECQVNEDYLTTILSRNTTFKIQGSKAEISAGWITLSAQGILKSAVLAKGRSFKTEGAANVFISPLAVVSFTPEEWLRVPDAR